MGDSLQEGKHHENPISSKPLNAAFVFDHARTLAALSRTVRINPPNFSSAPPMGSTDGGRAQCTTNVGSLKHLPTWL